MENKSPLLKDNAILWRRKTRSFVDIPIRIVSINNNNGKVPGTFNLQGRRSREDFVFHIRARIEEGEWGKKESKKNGSNPSLSYELNYEYIPLFARLLFFCSTFRHSNAFHEYFRVEDLSFTHSLGLSDTFSFFLLSIFPLPPSLGWNKNKNK